MLARCPNQIGNVFLTFVVPRQRVESRGLGVGVDEARPILVEKSRHTGRSRPAVHPDGKRRIFRVFTGLKEPEKGVDRVGLRQATRHIQGSGRKVDVPRVGLDSWGRLAKPRLFDW